MRPWATVAAGALFVLLVIVLRWFAGGEETVESMGLAGTLV